VNRWFVLASGPSLTPEDLTRVWKEWNEERCTVIAVNSTIFSAPWADILFALDHHWWKRYGAQVADLPCERLTSSQNSLQFGPDLIPKRPGQFMADGGVVGQNSGQVAVEIARLRGATEIVMLGVDFCHVDGKTHHHGDHPGGLGNADKPHRWLHYFEGLAGCLKERGVRAINCSPYYPGEGFERMTLEALLDGDG
jgi:hypothetical protein